MARQIQRNLKNICYLLFVICYCFHESRKAGKWNTFLASFIIPLSWQEWLTFCFVTWCKIFLKISHQTARREAPLFSKVGLRKFVLASELFALRPYFIRHVISKGPAEISSLLPQFIFRSGRLKVQLKMKIWNHTSLFWILVNKGVGKRFFILSSLKICIKFYVKRNSLLARRD